MRLARIALAAAVFLGCARGIANKPADADVARAHYTTGLSYYDRLQYKLAAREFLESYRLSPRPELLYNIARAYEKLGDLGLALDFYGRYLPAARAIDAREVQATMAALSGHVASVRVQTSDTNAMAFVDGEPRDGVPPGPFLVTEGQRTLMLVSGDE